MISLHLLRRIPPSVRQILLQERRRRFSYCVVSRHDADSAGKYRRSDRMALKCKPFVNSVDDIQIIETKPNILSPVELNGVVSHEIQPVTVILQQINVSPTQVLASDTAPSTSSHGSSSNNFSSQDITRQPPKEPAERFPEGRPNWTHLEHVKIRLTETVHKDFALLSIYCKTCID
jgi:hypothetical protein